MTNLKSQALSGIKWTALAGILGSLIQLIQISVLARYLVPSDFGLMAMAMIVVGFSQSLADMGLSNAIIQQQEIDEDQLNSLFWLNFFAGFVVFLFIYAFSNYFAQLYKEPQLKLILRLLGLIFIIQAFGQQFRVLMQKNLEFKILSSIELFSSVLSFLISTILAMKGHGVYALIWSSIINVIILNFLFFYFGLSFHKPRLYFSLPKIQNFLSFGLFQMGERTINYFSANMDKILIGKFLGMETVGFYDLAWRLIMYPVLKINPIINRVAFPIYSKLKGNRTTLNRYYLFSLHALSLATIPIFAFLFFYSYEVVEFMYGSSWTVTANLLKILSFVGLIKVLGNPGGAIVLSEGRADIGFFWNIVWTLLLAISFYYSLIKGSNIIQVAYILLFVSLGSSLIWHYMVHILGEINYKVIFKVIFRIFLASYVFGYISTYFLKIFENHLFKDNLINGIIVCTSFLSLYLYLCEKELISFLINKRLPE